MPAAHRGTRLQGPRNIPVPPTVLAVSFGQLSLGVLGAAASALRAHPRAQGKLPRDVRAL